MNFRLAKKQVALFFGVLIVTIAIGYGMLVYLHDHSGSRPDQSHIVQLRSTGAFPDVKTVEKGSYIEFDARDGRSHNIYEGLAHAGHESASTNKVTESGIFGVDSGYRVTFSQVGTYEFHDYLHDNITITVIVYEPKSK